MTTEKHRPRRALSANAVGIALVAPLALFLLATFFIPLGGMLFLSVDDRELGKVMPGTVAALADWDGAGLPGPAAFEAAGRDLVEARKAKIAGTAARRLGYEASAWRTTIQSTARALPRDIAAVTDWKSTLIAADDAWGKPDIWQALARARGPLTDVYLSSALGLQGGQDSTLYVNVLARTFVIALSATAICILLALPAAYLLASVGPITANLLMMALLLPLWTSVLVRSTSWLVILQKNGIFNQVLISLNIIDTPLELVYNRIGVLVALTHILLPYAVLPLYASMKALPRSQMQAARSLGAGPLNSFFRIYLPQIVPGISAGGLLVFILALGYYITPLLLGGQGDQMLPFYIAYNTLQALNWGLAAALASILLIATVILYALYVRLVGVQRVGV
ncbi:ABC-type spermidine/putrescine transport system, permease component I [Mesorhizobium prunaredense]|uniref:ABC-type spermidine/putrescine transport system, permease component I n=1 Tax=Mesorhizobium prunaredense TaxID=1631249 RepID=A0A1R3V3C7_9HYPH|nr:ABC transporter permease [Mesorhizobium prunaredense]SIT53727.1 ABC-type spermidine/putrescine transport system, permease component I [Mesorhizobium prunaredense]